MSYQDRSEFLMKLACPVGLQGAGTTALPTSTLDVGRGRCALGRLGALVVTQQDSLWTCGAAAVPQGRDHDIPEAQVSGREGSQGHVHACLLMQELLLHRHLWVPSSLP